MPRVNGPVHAAAADGAGGWYVGGEFVFAGGRTRANTARISGTGNVTTTWAPTVDGPVRAIAVRGNVVYLGGAFGTVNGAARHNVAALDAATGDARPWGAALGGAASALAVSEGTVYVGGATAVSAVDAGTGAVAWTAGTDGPVRALAVSGGTVYAGGAFLAVAGSPRARLAALSATSGALAPWAPSADGTVTTLAPAPDAATVYAGGEFTQVAGVARNRTAAVRVADGSVADWHPSAEAAVATLAVSGTRVLVGGAYTMLNGLPRRNAAALTAAGEVDPLWNPSPDDVTYAVEPNADGSVLFLGGKFLNLGPAARSRLAAVNPTTGEPLLRTAWPTGANGNVRALEVSGNRLYVGGAFTKMSGVDTGRLGAVSVANGAIDTAFAPRPGGTVRALVVSPDGTKLYATGEFTTIAGASRPGAAELVAATGAVTSFAPTTGGVVIAVALTPDGSRLFFSTTSNRTHAYDPAAANTPRYTIRTGGDVQGIAASATEVYVGGHFTNLPEAKLARMHAASFLAATGAITAWNPNPDGVFGVWSIEITPDALLLGGDFEKVGGKAQPGFARLPGTA
ncbi:MAG TPA: hypothetical protein VFT95_09820 [Micromonosporaceae bacterium]|nr:hypothetical protein [Micromonosporaceae bacterium]